MCQALGHTPNTYDLTYSLQPFRYHIILTFNLDPERRSHLPQVTQSVAEPVLEFGTRTSTLPFGGYPGLASPAAPAPAPPAPLFPLTQSLGGWGQRLRAPATHFTQLSWKPTSQPGGFPSSVLVTGPRRGRTPPTPTASPNHNFRTSSFYFCFLPPSTPPMSTASSQGLAQGWRERDRFLCPKGTEQSWCGFAGPCETSDLPSPKDQLNPQAQQRPSPLKRAHIVLY